MDSFKSFIQEREIEITVLKDSNELVNKLKT